MSARDDAAATLFFYFELALTRAGGPGLSPDNRGELGTVVDRIVDAAAESGEPHRRLVLRTIAAIERRLDRLEEPEEEEPPALGLERRVVEAVEAIARELVALRMAINKPPGATL